MSMNVLAIAGNFFLFIGGLEKFQFMERSGLSYFWHVIEYLEYSCCRGPQPSTTVSTQFCSNYRLFEIV